MTEEQKELREEKKCNCLCNSDGFKKFVIVSAGSFVGVFCALSLFAALHKPPMMMPCPYRSMMRPPAPHCQCFRGDRKFRGEFGKRDFRGDMRKLPDKQDDRTPFDPKRIED